MNEEIKEIVWNEVWFGINPKNQIISIVFDNFLNDEAPDEMELGKEIDRVIELKNENESSWKPREESDFYKLSRAFDNLHLDGIIAVHNAGYTQSDCLDSVSEVLSQVDKEKIIGYCFYHEQDIERLIPEFSSNEIKQNTGNLLLGFGSIDDSDSNSEKVAKTIIGRLKQFNLDVNWDGDLNERIEVKDFMWQKKLDINDWTGYRSVFLLNEHIPKQDITETKRSKKGWKFWKK
jgi:hypothetical protein